MAEPEVIADNPPSNEPPTLPSAEDAGRNGDQAADKALQSVAEEPEKIAALRVAMEASQPVEGKIIGWNNGGFHVVVGDVTAFCPRSEMESGPVNEPESYVDQTYPFEVLKIHRGGRRVVLSRVGVIRAERKQARQDAVKELAAGVVTKGTVASLTDFGAFVDLNGVQGLVHVSEMSRNRVERPSDMLEVGQEVEVKVLRVENSGRRISLSMKALEPDPWDGVEKLFEVGSVVTGKVERTAKFGAFVELAPGLTGLLPTSLMALPREASPARVFPSGKEIQVQVLNVDRRRRRISLGLEGSATEGSKQDFDAYQRQNEDADSGFNALAAALKKADVASAK